MRKKLVLIISGVCVIFTISGVCWSSGNEKAQIVKDEYEISVNAVEKRVEISIKGKSEYHCNTMYPWKLTLSGKDEERVIKKEDAKTFNEKEVVFNFLKKGSHSAVLKLSVCNDTQCLMKKEIVKF